MNSPREGAGGGLWENCPTHKMRGISLCGVFADAMRWSVDSVRVAVELSEDRITAAHSGDGVGDHVVVLGDQPFSADQAVHVDIECHGHCFAGVALCATAGGLPSTSVHIVYNTSGEITSRGPVRLNHSR